VTGESIVTTHFQRLVIAHAWDGRPLPQAEHVSVTISLQGVGNRPAPDGQMVVSIDAPFFHDPAPPATTGDPRSYDELWNYEVVELFVGPRGDAPGAFPYLELEFGPHGHALGLVFSAYRQKIRQVSVPGHAALRADRWRAQAIIAGELLPPPPWTLNAYCIHGAPSARQYGAAFPPGCSMAPDFHDRGSWRESELSWPVD